MYFKRLFLKTSTAFSTEVEPAISASIYIMTSDSSGDEMASSRKKSKEAAEAGAVKLPEAVPAGATGTEDAAC